MRQRDWPRVGERKAQPADIEIKIRLLLEYFLEKQPGYAVSLVEFSDIKYFCNFSTNPSQSYWCVYSVHLLS